MPRRKQEAKPLRIKTEAAPHEEAIRQYFDKVAVSLQDACETAKRVIETAEGFLTRVGASSEATRGVQGPPPSENRGGGGTTPGNRGRASS